MFILNIAASPMVVQKRNILMSGKKILAELFCSLALLCCSSVGKSQNNSLYSWYNANVEYYLNKKWNLLGEAQVRSQKLADQFYYHDWKGGVNFRPNKNFGIVLGAGQNATYSNGGNFKSPVLNHEFRLWEQFTLINNIDRLKIEHRYRIEQRWRTDGYRNRFRYRLNPIIPINKSTIAKGTLYVSIYDEIFFINTGQYFERNRAFGGLGYQFSSPFSLQIGWLRQFDYAGNRSGSKINFLQTIIFFRVNKFKSDHAVHPSSVD